VSPWINATGPGRGAAPDFLSQPAQKIIRLDLARNVALFSREIEVPLAPFMGIVAVAPPPETPRVSTKPPGAYGGNIDFKHLTAGSTLYLPVFNDGALFTGDGHGGRGTAKSTAGDRDLLTPTLQFFVLGAGTLMKYPR
jgi:acetamidase/formamidase